MAKRSAVSERVNWAAAQLAECHPTSVVVAQMSQRWGCSRRQSQRIVKRAHQQLVDDLELVGVERVHVVAQLHTALFSGWQPPSVVTSRQLLWGLAGR